MNKTGTRKTVSVYALMKLYVYVYNVIYHVFVYF